LFGRETDAELLAAAGSDPEAFGRFYDRYEAAVAGYFLRRTAVPEVAADLTAEVFANVLQAAARYRQEGPTAAAWLFTIARNTLSNSARRSEVEARARHRVGAEPIELREDSLARLTAVDGERWVDEMLDRLPADQREVIRARILDERDYPDIARELRTSEMVVRKRVAAGMSSSPRPALTAGTSVRCVSTTGRPATWRPPPVLTDAGYGSRQELKDLHQ
jgi:RNA polymerase sigma factor (sigma-70 family)